MWVEFEFGLAGQRYRVWRQRSKKGRGQSDLHFYVWDDKSADWQVLDDGGLLERQAQITRTLRLDYDTFTNSSFLLQGRADSFTVKTASERKQILADILGLSRYDLYEERAKAEAQTRKERAGLIEGEIKAIERDLAAPRRLRGAAQRGACGRVGRGRCAAAGGSRAGGLPVASRGVAVAGAPASPICVTAWAAPNRS